MIFPTDISAFEDLIALCKEELDLSNTKVQEILMFAEKAIDNLKELNLNEKV